MQFQSPIRFRQVQDRLSGITSGNAGPASPAEGLCLLVDSRSYWQSVILARINPMSEIPTADFSVLNNLNTYTHRAQTHTRV